MKFLLIVLALRFIAGLIMVDPRNKGTKNISENEDRDVRHPAEFELR
ncbi:MAG TPA: hypothetical protein PKC72_16830 [Chitinophagaceae bacterium]|nr:hypothetical protein [Chitinophagaceae bacterium]